MARLPIPGSDRGTWGEVLNQFLDVEHNTDGTLKQSGSLSDKAPLDSPLFTGSVTVNGTSVVVSSDSRLTDARSPTSHASSHASAGADPLTIAQSQVSNLTSDLGEKEATGVAAGRTMTGLLANRPSAVALSDGVRYFAEDDQGGTLYIVSSASWNQAAAPAIQTSGLIASCQPLAIATFGLTGTVDYHIPELTTTAFSMPNRPVRVSLHMPLLVNCTTSTTANIKMRINGGAWNAICSEPAYAAGRWATIWAPVLATVGASVEISAAVNHPTNVATVIPVVTTSLPAVIDVIAF